MKVLLTSATPFEIAPTIAWLEKDFEKDDLSTFVKGDLVIQICVTGIGILATGWKLGAVFSKQKPDFAINVGIAGALDHRIPLGDVVHITEEVLADLGVEDSQGRLIDLFELGFCDANIFPFRAGKLINQGAAVANFLPAVKAITLNKAQGAAMSIAKTREKYPEAQVESMEGGAFFYACLLAGLPFVEIRSISNYVEPRNKEAWNIPLAIHNLNQVLQQMLTGLMVD
jgi:futalosine hydrolase